MFLDRLITFFTSLKLTVVCLVLAMLLVFIGTLAQEPLGLYAVQARFFRSFFVDAGAFYAALHKFADMILQGLGRPLQPVDAQALLAWPRVPVFPGGYLIGGVLLINLITAHVARFGSGKDKIGGWLTHGGLVLLLVGQLATDLLSTESHMRLHEGQSKNYSESGRLAELAVVDVTDPNTDKVVAIPDSVLARRKVISHPALPFTIHVQRFLANSRLSDRAEAGFKKSPATQDIGSQVWLRAEPKVTKLDRRDVPSALIELRTSQGSLGTWLVSEFISQPQSVTVNDRTYELTQRLRRYYKPFALELLQFSFDKYPGSEIPKNFSSRVRVVAADTGEDREVLIKMNNPLRHGGETFYQSGYDENDPRVTILQVVRNPGWLTPYVACTLVGVGLTIQFLSHLIGFLGKRRAA